MLKINQIQIDQDLGIQYQDCGPWRSYWIDTYGDTREELEINATILELDQDGGELNCYGLDAASSEVFDAVDRIITRYIRRKAG